MMDEKINEPSREQLVKGKILVADDEKVICQLLEEFLVSINYEVVCAYDGAEALKKISQEKPRFVLLDYQMPEMTGLQVLTELRKTYPELVVIMMTGVDEEWIWDRARSMGAYGFLMKPIDFSYLENLLVTKLV